jgi:hypothetical protein
MHIFHGSPNICANAPNLILIAWSFKIVFALITDSYKPFGLRRRPWMIFRFTSVLFVLAIPMITAESLTASNWLTLLLFMNIGLMFADVPTDGYSVQIGGMGPFATRGKVAKSFNLHLLQWQVYFKLFY